MSLAPSTIEIIFACSSLSNIEGTKAWLGIALSLRSTIVFVAQSFWLKKLLGRALSGGTFEGAKDRRPSQGGGEVKLDKLSILFWSSGVSVFLMTAILWSDRPKMYAVFQSSDGGTLASVQRTEAARVASHISRAASREKTMLGNFAISVSGLGTDCGNTAKVIGPLLLQGLRTLSQKSPLLLRPWINQPCDVQHCKHLQGSVYCLFRHSLV